MIAGAIKVHFDTFYGTHRDEGQTRSVISVELELSLCVWQCSPAHIYHRQSITDATLKKKYIFSREITRKTIIIVEWW